MASLGDGLRALRELALTEHHPLAEHSALTERLLDEIAYEAHKFVLFRAGKLREREHYSLCRVRSLRAMLKLTAA
jgi:hypothetical protein